MTRHVPALTQEVIGAFAPQAGDQLLDATVGTGGHTAAYLNAGQATRAVGLDADPGALAEAGQRLASFGTRVRLVRGTYARLKDSLQGGGILMDRSSSVFNHILFDLGVGSHQLSDPGRGFSFTSSAPLLMRYGDTLLPPSRHAVLNMLEARLARPPEAFEIIRQLAVNELTDLLRQSGVEREARRIAVALKHAKPLPLTAAGIAAVIARAVPRHGHLHPATKTFQALRLAVNRELESLAAALPEAVSLLKPGGILAVISWHSLEDQVVKTYLRSRPDLERLQKKPVTPRALELARNPRARSARLRSARLSP